MHIPVIESAVLNKQIDRMVRRPLTHQFFDAMLNVIDWHIESIDKLVQTKAGATMFLIWFCGWVVGLTVDALLLVLIALQYWFPVGIAAVIVYGIYYHYTRIWLWPYREHLARMRRYDTNDVEREIQREAA